MRHLAQWVVVVGTLARSLAAQDQPAPDPADQFRSKVSQLADRSRKNQEAAIQALAALKNPDAIPALTALRQSRLYHWTEKEGAEPRLVIRTDRKSEQKFLDDGTETSCRIYAVRPAKCRTWPFWEELLDPDRLREAMHVCPGITTDGGDVAPKPP